MFLKVGGWAAILFGTFMGLGVFSTIGQGHTFAAVAGAFVLFSVGPITGGVLALLHERRSLRQLPANIPSRRQLDPAGWEIELRRLAEKRQGNLTVDEVVLATGLEASRVEGLLDGLCKKGLADYRVADEGVIVYRIQPVLGAAEKATARGLLD